MTPLALTSITDFILAAGTLFLAGLLGGALKSRFSAAWYWAGMLGLLGLGALLGGIDHGFIEPAQLPRYWIQRSDWIVLGAATFCVLQATAKQFFPPRAQRIVLIIGAMQLAVNISVDLLIDSFLDVALNYVPVMILLLAVNTARLRTGGSWQMTAGVLTLFAATGIQVAGFDALTPLDHNGVYHVVSLLGVVLLYFAGLRLKR
jgi:hypothetical protein